MKRLYDLSRPFFKGNLHMHSTLSDGRLSPEAALRSYRAKGYDFVARTDHWRASEAGELSGMTVLPGIELDAQVDARQVAHIVGVGFDPVALDVSVRPSRAQALVDAIRSAGGVAILAHPAWSMNTPDFIESLEGLCAAEIMNTFSGAPWNVDRGDSSHILDLVSAGGTCLPLVASDDSHRYDGEAGVSWTMANARDASPAALMEALRAGRFYASQGPSFRQVALDGHVISVSCSPVARAVFYSNMQGGPNRLVTGHDMTEISYEIKPQEHFIRVELTDRFGRRAWSSPVGL